MVWLGKRDYHDTITVFSRSRIEANFVRSYEIRCLKLFLTEASVVFN